MRWFSLALGVSLAVLQLQTSKATTSAPQALATPSSRRPATTELKTVIPFPFEVVHHAWENGPQDPNFLREDKTETWNKNELLVTKTIYTKNPFPYVVRKTVIRDEQLVFYEEQKINTKQRYATYWSINKALSNFGKASRKAEMRADPDHPGWTVFEQSGGVEVTANIAESLKTTIEKFACNAFLQICKKAAEDLELNLKNSAAKQAVVEEGSSEIKELEDVTALVHEPERHMMWPVRGLLFLFTWLATHPGVIVATLLSPLVAHPPTQPVQLKHEHKVSEIQHEHGAHFHKDGRRHVNLHRLVGAAAAFVAPVPVKSGLPTAFWS